MRLLTQVTHSSGDQVESPLQVLLKARGRKSVASLCFVSRALLVKAATGQPRFKGVERIEPPLWRRFCASIAGGTYLIPDWGTNMSL